MKQMKWLVPLAVVVLLLMVAMPAAADDPFGGPPSKTSGNGTTTWAAIYIGGTWDNKVSVNQAGTGAAGVFAPHENFYKNPNSFSPSTGVVATKEYDQYVTNWSAKITIPAGSSRWFKFDTVKSRDVQVYVDDVPKWGAAYRYFGDGDCRFSGVGDCDKADNLLRIGIDTSEIGKWWLATQDRYDFSIDEVKFRNGFAARVYTPGSIQQPDYFWPTPNNALLTTRAGSRARVADTAGARGGYGRGTLSVAAQGNEPAVVYLEPGDVKKARDGNTHLLMGEFHWDGWVYVRVFNNMIWDGDIMIGTRYTPNSKYDFPCDNCPYPFNP